MTPTDKPNLDSQPRELAVSGRDIFIIDEIKLRGGHVFGMEREKQNGHWKLLIHWPERALFSD
jgi:hypothetical protein